MARERPDLDTFRQLAARGNLVPIYRQLMSDQLTPVLAYRRLVKALRLEGSISSCIPITRRTLKEGF